MNRRQFLLTGAALAAVNGIALSNVRAATSSAKARIVIAGAGAAGLALASRLRRQMPQAAITVIDEKTVHHFQPGFTLVGAGLWSPDDVTFRNADFMPSGADWITQAVAEFDPDSNTVATSSGRRVPYDFLFVATGLALDYERIEGMDRSLIGTNGIASIYANPPAAAASFRAIDAFVDQGGVGLFGRPTTEMKCAGAPLKVTFITDDLARRKGRRRAVKLVYNAHNPTVFPFRPYMTASRKCLPRATLPSISAMSSRPSIRAQNEQPMRRRRAWSHLITTLFMSYHPCARRMRS